MALIANVIFANVIFTVRSSEYRIGTVLQKTESRHVEYKTGGGNYPIHVLPSHIRKYGSAYLNSSGGILCVGVTDEGEYFEM